MKNFQRLHFVYDKSMKWDCWTNWNLLIIAKSFCIIFHSNQQGMRVSVFSQFSTKICCNFSWLFYQINNKLYLVQFILGFLLILPKSLRKRKLCFPADSPLSWFILLLSGECMLLGSLSRHIKDLEWCYYCETSLGVLQQG